MTKIIDPLTGLKVVPGKVYGPNSDVAIALSGGSVDNVTVRKAQYLLDKKAFVLSTVHEPPRDDSGSVSQRNVFLGQFRKNKGGALTGRIERYASGYRNKYWISSDPALREEYYESVWVQDSYYSVAIKNSKGLDQAMQAFPWADKTTLQYNNFGKGYYEDYSGNQVLATSSKDQFSSLGIDKYLGGNWWDNIFSQK